MSDVAPILLQLLSVALQFTTAGHDAGGVAR
jgi:hypothetical protein